MLGHLRHELGHYFWPVLVDRRRRVGERAGRCSATSAPTTSEALERHYDDGPPADWAERHVSAYATMHPWEDWAETFAHYLHIRDTLADRRGLRRSSSAGPRAVTFDRSLKATPAARGRRGRRSARCSTTGYRSPTRSTPSTAAWAATTSTRSCSRRPVIEKLELRPRADARGRVTRAAPGSGRGRVTRAAPGSGRCRVTRAAPGSGRGRRRAGLTAAVRFPPHLGVPARDHLRSRGP